MSKTYKIQSRLYLVVFCVTVLLSTAFMGIPAAYASSTDENIEEAGDWLQFIIPAAGLVGTYIADDEEGRYQFWKNYASSIAITTIAKGIYSKTRPSSLNKASFPSGHTTSAFAGAGFIDQRYGHLWGSLAYAAAAFVGWSRVHSDNHFADDVLAGASVGLFNSWYWVSPHKSNVSLMPLVKDDGMGVMISVQDPTAIKEDQIEKGKRRRKFRYEMDFGWAFLQKNEITALASTGTTIDLADFNQNDDQLTSAAAYLDWFITDHHTLLFGFWPLESRDTGTFSQPTNFNGVIFPANTPVNSSWRHYYLDVMYYYDFFNKSRWDFRLGIGVTGQWTNFRLATTDGSQFSKVEDSVILPLVHIGGGINITPKWNVDASVTGMYLDTDKYFQGSLTARYQFSKRWNAGIGIGNYSRDIETSKLIEKFRYDTLYLTVSHTFF